MKHASLGIGLIGSDKQGAFLRGLRSLQYIELSYNQSKKYDPAKSKNCKLFADTLMLFPESRMSPRFDISTYSNEFGKFSAMLLSIIGTLSNETCITWYWINWFRQTRSLLARSKIITIY
jgi:hypothetical protein